MSQLSKFKPKHLVDPASLAELDTISHARAMYTLVKSSSWDSIKKAAAIVERRIIETIIDPKVAEYDKTKDHLLGQLYGIRSFLAEIEQAAHWSEDEAKKNADEVSPKGT